MKLVPLTALLFILAVGLCSAGALNFTIEYGNQSYCNYSNDASSPAISYLAVSPAAIPQNSLVSVNTDARDSESGLASCSVILLFPDRTRVAQSGSNGGPQYFPSSNFGPDCKGTIYFNDGYPPTNGRGSYILQVNITNNRTCTRSSSIFEATVTYGIANASCTEDWLCMDWSACVNNAHARTCTDRNSCGTTAARPALSQECTVQQQSDTQSTGGGSGGGGGGGASAPVNLNLVRHDYQSVTAAGINWTINSSRIPVTGIALVPKADAVNVILKVELIQNMSFDNLTYAYLRITHENLEGFKEVHISFKVENAWLQANKISRVYLGRLSENKWQQLSTKETKKDARFTYYLADSSGLSDFTISGSQEKTSATNKNAAAEPTVTGAVIQESAPESNAINNASNMETQDTVTAGKWIGFAVILALLILAVAAYMAFRRA